MWEYLVLDNWQKLHFAGKEGWELVSVVIVPQYGIRYYCKRQTK